ncbi:TagF domain-containing protein [Thauera sinica]|uniref:TagF domain-containing protein n=1 Tax=Thauera sinica TaxID=2665146 RepID=A0ABW1ATL7_9RHOO|nr:TagF domain-containing protein [Thauera sp. K11]ATE59937.1 hypothetical protein CCZ27_08235 [Thauera sp. K11]
MIRRFFRRYLAAPLPAPSVWGKLPALGDYVSRHASPADIAAWQRWFEVYPLDRLSESAIDLDEAPPARAAASDRWLSTEPVAVPGREHPLPWCFILPPDALPQAPRLPAGLPVIGVMARSCDRVGRLHPLVVWQSVQPRWLVDHRQTQEWLFWLSSYLVCHTLPYSTPEAFNPVPFLDLLDALWHTASPGPAARLGLAPKPLPDGELTRLIAEAKPAGLFRAKRNPADDLAGVRHLPWADWPLAAIRPMGFGQRRAYFWQHAANGEYVGLAAPQVGWRGERP